VVLVVYREFVQVGLLEFARAAPADPREEFQGLGAVPLLALVARTACVGDDAIEPAEVGSHALAGRHAPIVRTRARIWKGDDDGRSGKGAGHSAN
jgi:hypothetical protein